MLQSAELLLGEGQKAISLLATSRMLPAANSLPDVPHHPPVCTDQLDLIQAQKHVLDDSESYDSLKKRFSFSRSRIMPASTSVAT